MGVPDGASNTEKGMKTSHNAAGRHLPWWRQKCVLVLAACLAAVLVVMLIAIPILTNNSTCESVSDTTSTLLLTYADLSAKVIVDPEYMLSDGRPIVRRWEWSDVPPDFRRPLHHPTPYVVIGHTAGTVCSGEAECFDLLRAYRNEHRVKWAQPDITYNFLIDVNGNVYEGRGWDATNNFSSWVMRCNLGVALLGNFMIYNVTTTMLHSLQQLLDLGVRLGKLSPDYRLVAQNQVMATLSPGTYVLKAIESWPHRCLRDCDVGVECIFKEPEFMLSDGRPIVRRWEWSDVPPDFRRPLHHPTPYVVIGHTAGTVCSGEAECFDLLRAYRNVHRERWAQPDITYNFLIDVKGNVYEGRGWDVTNNFWSWVMRCNLGVALMGNFMNYNVTTAMLHSLQQLLDLGVRLGKLSPDYRLVAENQVRATLSPGTYVLKAVESWPHRCLRDCDVGVECVFQGTVETDA